MHSSAFHDCCAVGVAPATEAIRADTAALGFAMGSTDRNGQMLRVLAASKPGGRILELGTGTGLAAAWLLHGMSGGATLDTVDNDPVCSAVARRHLGHPHADQRQHRHGRR